MSSENGEKQKEINSTIIQVMEIQEADTERPFEDLEARVIIDSGGNKHLIYEAEMKVEPGHGVAKRQQAKLTAIEPGDFLRIISHPWPQPTGFKQEVEILPPSQKEVEWS